MTQVVSDIAVTPGLDRPLGELEVVASLTEVQSRGKIPLSRFIHGSAEINGKIFVCGGRDKESTSLSDTFLYDPVTSTCHELAELPNPRCGHTVVSHDEKLVCFGGYDGTSFNNEVLAYHPKDNKWVSQGTGGPTARYCHCAAVVDTKMYVFGGDNHKDKLNDLWCLDLGTYKWSEVRLKGRNNPDSRQGACAAVYGGKIYSFGGFDKHKHAASNEMWCFDPEKNEWSAVETNGTIPNGRHGHAGVVLGDSWIIHGGRKDHGEKYNIDVYDFQFDACEWRRLGVVQHAASPWGCPAVRFGHQAVLEPYSNAIFITGGYTHTDGVTFCPTNSTMRLDLLPTLHSVTAITSRIAPLENKMGQLVEDAKEVKDDVEAMKEKMRELADDIPAIKEKQELIEDKVAPLIEAVPKIEDAVKTVDDRVAGVEDAARDMGEKLNDAEDKAKILDDRVAKLEDDVGQLQDLAGISKDQDDLKKDLADVRERALPNLEDNLNDIGKKNEEYQARLDDLMDKLQDLEGKEKELEDREADLEGKEADLADKLGKLADDVAALQGDNDALKDGVNGLDGLKDKLAQLEGENEELRASLNKLADLSELYQRVESLRAAMDKTIAETQKMRSLGEVMSGYGHDIPVPDFPPYNEK